MHTAVNGSNASSYCKTTQKPEFEAQACDLRRLSPACPLSVKFKDTSMSSMELQGAHRNEEKTYEATTIISGLMILSSMFRRFFTTCAFSLPLWATGSMTNATALPLVALMFLQTSRASSTKVPPTTAQTVPEAKPRNE